MKFDNSLGTHVLGAAGELIAAADLTMKGFEVFRAVSPRCSCDLIAMKDGKTYRVEVKVGMSFLPTTNEKYDLLAIVLGLGTDRQHVKYKGIKELEPSSVDDLITTVIKIKVGSL